MAAVALLAFCGTSDATTSKATSKKHTKAPVAETSKSVTDPSTPKGDAAASSKDAPVKETADKTDAAEAANKAAAHDQNADDTEASVQGPKVPDTWSPAEIADAKARCAYILKKITAVVIPEAPIKEGVCGAPAPVQLISIGSKPQVSISPPAILTCEMVEALNTWISGDLQPLAKAQLGSEIIKIETMSSYACRNAYGRVGGKLSEHGHANALDIRGFVTASAKTAYVLEHWGTPQREILARLAAQKAAAEKAALAQAAAEKAAQANQIAEKTPGKPSGTEKIPPAATASTLGAPAAGIARTTIADGVPKLTVTIPGAKPDAKARPTFGMAEPDRLGGPKDGDPGAPVKRTSFIHAAHASACRIFGTTLGPEANAAHRNHLHVDMAPRKVTKICD